MQRQKIADRIDHDYNDKIDCMDKSNWKCAHCGTPIKMRDNATLDHFIPLSMGGINQKLNIIPLCNKCNERKTNKIVNPEWYVKYMAEKYKKPLMEYFESYINSFEYLSRWNLLSCDIYELRIYMGPRLRHLKPKVREKIEEKASIAYLLERVFPEELPELEEFFIDYLKKYNGLRSVEEVHRNIEFWNKFGTIYVIRDKQTNEIRLMAPILVGKVEDGPAEYQIQMFIFSKYATDLSCTLVKWMPELISGEILHDHRLPYVLIQTNIPSDDKTAIALWEAYDGVQKVGGWTCLFWRCGISEEEADSLEYDPKQDPFYHHFTDVEEEMDSFFAQDGYDHCKWLGSFIIPNYAESNHKDLKQVNHNNEYVRPDSSTNFKPDTDGDKTS